MRGKIKFVDSKTGQWGFIVAEDGSGDVHFRVADFSPPRPTPQDSDLNVEFELQEDDDGRHARSARLLDPPDRENEPRLGAVNSPSQSLNGWGFLPYTINYTSPSGREYSSALGYLADMALEEAWHFGETPNPRNPYPILENYLKYTFFKLQKEGKVSESQSHAAFNTGLVDRLYDPVYALFVRNDRVAPAWKFYDFCVPGKGPSGRQLTSAFAPLPKPTTYFSSNFDMLLDTSQEIHVDYEHVIYDGVERDRFPQEFLAHNVPRGFDFRDYRKMGTVDRLTFLRELRSAIQGDLQCTRAIKNRLEDAKTLAEKRTRWNFKTAIPQYYPRYDVMSLLLPLALVNDEVVDISLVVTRNPSGSYQGRTILPLAWAYKNARLVCRPDSDWLVPKLVPLEGDVEDDTDEDI